MSFKVLRANEPYGDDSQVKITRFDAVYLDGALAVLEEGLGRGYVTREELVKYVNDGVSRLLMPRTHIAYPAVLKNGTVVGAITADHVKTSDRLLEFVPERMRERFMSLVPEVKHTDVALLHSAAVSPLHQGKGVASALVREAVYSLQRQGVETIVAVGWTDDRGCHIQGTLERAGFVACGDIPGYWTADSIEKKYACPSCDYPCRCDARIFGLFGVSILGGFK